MTTAFTGWLQFTGKNPAFTWSKGRLELFTIVPGSQIALLRCINKLQPHLQDIK